MSVMRRGGAQLEREEWDASGMDLDPDPQTDLVAIAYAVMADHATPQDERVRLVRALVHMTAGAFPEAEQ